MRLGAFYLPGISPAAVASVQNPPANSGGEPLPGVYELEEIGGTAPRDYLPTFIALGIVALVLLNKRRA